MPNYASEFTPELNQQYLASLLNNIDEKAVSDESRARAEGVSGGLGFQAAMGSEIGLAREGANRDRTNTISKFNFDVAGLKRDERMTQEKENFQDTERARQNDFQMALTKMGYEFQDSQRNNQNRADKIAGEQGLVEGSLATIGVNALNPGNYFGKGK